MNIKGLKLDRILVKKLFDKKVDLSKIRGLEPFNNFQWKNFNNEEFYSLLEAFIKFDPILFKNCSDKNLFIFNYSTDVTEMDIVTVMLIDNEPIFIDIEVKKGEFEDISKGIDTQIDKRKKYLLPQLIKNNKYITIGIINNDFFKACYFDGKNHNDIEDCNDLSILFNTFKEYNSVGEYLVQFSDIASISKICDDIRNKKYNFYEETNRIYNNILEKTKQYNVIFIYGNAGTGKSVLALRLFFENNNTRMLILNSKLYNALDLGGQLYFNQQTTYNSKIFIDTLKENDIAIIDEAQRLSIDEMKSIADKAKVAVFFGDSRQAWSEKSTIDNSKKLKELFNNFGYKVYERTLTKSRRYSDEVNKALNFLTSNDSSIDDKLPQNYSINLFYDEKEFLSAYNSVSELKKIFVPAFDVNDDIIISNKIFKRAGKTDDRFAIWSNILSDYYGTTYHALSFDVDHCFVYLPKTILIKESKKLYLFTSMRKNDMRGIQLYMNELNILFTRGRKSLNIFVNDIEAYLFLNAKLQKLIKK